MLGDTGTLVAVEPQPELAQLIRRTFSHSGIAGTVHQVAVGDRDEQAVLVVPRNRSGEATLLKEAVVGKHVPVTVRRLDDLLLPVTKGRRTLLKVDVEGHELPALKGATNFLAHHRPRILFELNPAAIIAAGYHPRELLEWLTAQRYLCTGVESLDRPLPAEMIDTDVSRDLMALPQSE